MAVNEEYVANLVAQLNADKVERDNEALAWAMCPELPWCDCGDWLCLWCN
jgi:hypothetical protein